MKSRQRLAEARTPDGGRLALFEQDDAFSISLNGQELMHSRAHASELLLGEVGLAHLAEARRETARILIGGLGLGFTLRSVLAAAGREARVEVVELLPAVVEWNRTHLRELNGGLLDDARVTVRTTDANRLIRRARPAGYDAILLDIDNGPVAMVVADNANLYAAGGLRAVRAALRPGGRAVFWSAGPDAAFARRLRQLEFQVEEIPAKVHERAKRAAYLLYVATRQDRGLAQ